MNVLTVPYLSQIQSGALEHNNDCGPTSGLMTARAYNLGMTLTPDAFYNMMQPSGDVPISVGQMQTAWNKIGLKSEWKVDLTTSHIFNYLIVNKPMVALIHYGTLVDAHLTEKTGFRGAHFVVISGIDIKNVNIKDPYRDDGVTDVAIPLNTFTQSWSECGLDGNPTNGAIMPLLPIQDLSPAPVPPPQGVAYKMIATVNGINVRSQPTSSSTLIKTIWRTGTNTPVFFVDGVVNNGTLGIWSHLVEGGYVYTAYIVKA
jgi:hypothetical protein